MNRFSNIINMVTTLIEKIVTLKQQFNDFWRVFWVVFFPELIKEISAVITAHNFVLYVQYHQD